MTEIDREGVKRFWDGRAALAADPRSTTLDRESSASVAREVARYQQWLFRRLDRDGVEIARAADLGCGNGDWTVALARRARYLQAVDLSPSFAAHTAARLAREVPACVARVTDGDVAAVELDAPLDVIVSGAVTQYLADAEVDAMLGRIARSLGPGGVFYFRSTIARGASFEKNDGDFHGIYREEAWYLDALGRAGLRVSERARATDFVADEWAHQALRGPLAILRPPARWLGRGLRRIYRSRRPTDVLVCLARRA